MGAAIVARTGHSISRLQH